MVDVHMRESDAFAWEMEHDPLLRSTIVAVTELGSNPDWERLVARVDRATRLIPSFRQKVVAVPFHLATPRWTFDPDFDLSWHLRHVALPGGSLDDVLDLARKAGMAAFDRDRPLWEFTVVEDLEHGRAAMILKVHHSLTDGIGGLQLAALVYDLSAEPTDLGPMPDAPPGEVLSMIDLTREAIVDDWRRLAAVAARRARRLLPDAFGVARHPRRSVRHAIETAVSIGHMVEPVNHTRSPVMVERHLTWRYEALDVPLAPLRDASHVAGGGLNCAFLGGVTAGLRLYHEEHGQPVDELRVTLPISIRHDGDPAGGNRITLVRVSVPVGLADPVERMRRLHERVAAWRDAPALEFTNVVAGALNLLPNAYVGGMLKHVDFLASNVPGVTVPVWLAGAPVERFYAFGPTIGAAINFTLMSYVDGCCVGVTFDTGAIPDHGRFMECLRRGFEEVLDVAGAHEPVTLRSRSAPAPA